MEPNWAADNLQVIRTLMERSALYRRAMAPIMLSTGGIGVAGAVTGISMSSPYGKVFVGYWVLICLVAVVVAFVIARRQAVKESEPFWTPPTRRVAMAFAAPFLAAAALTAVLVFAGWENGVLDVASSTVTLVAIWLVFYGCGLNSAGFFISRGVKILGWLFIICGILLSMVVAAGIRSDPLFLLRWNSLSNPHLVMGATFGGLHLASGIYLYFTEKRKNAA